MKELHKLIKSDFTQPHTTNYSRVLRNKEEIIEYPPNSHVRIWYNDAPYDYESHYHNCIEILFMYENNCEAKFPTQNIYLKTGDIIVIPPYMMHQITCTQQFKQFVLLMDVELLAQFDIKIANNNSINDILLCNKDTCPQIYDTIKNNIIDAINSYFINADYCQLEIYSYILYCFAMFGKNGFLSSSSSSSIVSSPKEHFEKFAELLQYIDLNFPENLSLDMISNQIGFSKYHFIRLFKEYTGMTFYEYLTNKRISHAKELLKTSSEITEIAFACGYNNQTSFCRSFKKEVGCPPTEYRHQIIKNSPGH